MCDHDFESRFGDSECSEAMVGPEDRGMGPSEEEEGVKVDEQRKHPPSQGLVHRVQPRPYDNRAFGGHNEHFRNFLIHHRMTSSSLYTLND
jgi:hypothetical protein